MSDFTKTELLREAQFRRCVEDPVFFFENFWHIKHPERGSILFELRDYQKEGLETFLTERQVITLKARQIGWTTLCAAFSFWAAYFHSDREIIFLSRKEDEAKHILAMVGYGYARLPPWLKEKGPDRTTDNTQDMQFGNGSKIESHPSKKDPARGRTAWLVILDEWAFLENPEDAWASIAPTIDVGGRVIGLSTANGINNIFYTLWQRATTGSSNFVKLFFPYWVVPGRDEEWYEKQKLDFLDWQLHQEYPRDPEEAFIKSGNMVFDTGTIDKVQPRPGEKKRLYRPPGGVFELRDPGNDSVPLTIWERPRIVGDYLIGADVAEGLEHGDKSCAYVYDLGTGEVVAEWYGLIEPDEFGEVLIDLGQYYFGALIAVESNNHGGTTLTALRRLKYPRIYHQRTHGKSANKATDKLGWNTNRNTKPLMIDELARGIKRDQIIIWSEQARRELQGYVRDENGKMGGSPNDDCVMALAIVAVVRQYAPQFPKKEIRPAKGTWNAVVQTIDDGNKRERRKIGQNCVRARW